ncbi:MAG TPA: OST-HTH/LOTUS domain-containing protein, partial [Vicinamibacterales bacterium]|nr:OST-HTH/LOTUS domain-containing protein [Vicinamibacterales bacterium]
FSERNYGSSSFLDFAEKLAQAGLVTLKTSGRSVMVELNPDFVETETADLKSGPPTELGAITDSEAPQAFRPAEERPVDERPADHSQSEGVSLVGTALRKATGARWPMYVRNIKQIIRAADGNFDERRYGFGGLMDLLRACQREGLIRMERDRRGGLRVFPGAAIQRGPSVPSESQPDVSQDEQIIDTAPDDAAPIVPVEADRIIDVEPQPVDTTAELLGRAKARRPRAKAAPPASVKKKRTAGKRNPRSKKSAAVDDDSIGNQ